MLGREDNAGQLGVVRIIVLCFQASKAVIVVGPQAKPYRAIEATVKLAKASQYATAVLPNAKACALHPFPTVPERALQYPCLQKWSE